MKLSWHFFYSFIFIRNLTYYTRNTLYSLIIRMTFKLVRAEGVGWNDYMNIYYDWQDGLSESTKTVTSFVIILKLYFSSTNDEGLWVA